MVEAVGRCGRRRRAGTSLRNFAQWARPPTTLVVPAANIAWWAWSSSEVTAPRRWPGRRGVRPARPSPGPRSAHTRSGSRPRRRPPGWTWPDIGAVEPEPMVIAVWGVSSSASSAACSRAWRHQLLGLGRERFGFLGVPGRLGLGQQCSDPGQQPGVQGRLGGAGGGRAGVLTVAGRGYDLGQGGAAVAEPEHPKRCGQGVVAGVARWPRPRPRPPGGSRIRPVSAWACSIEARQRGSQARGGVAADLGGHQIPGQLDRGR